MAAILEIGGHIEQIWIFKQYLYHQLNYLHDQIHHLLPK